MSVKCCISTKYSGQTVWIAVIKLGVVIKGRSGQRCSCGKMALHHQTFITAYVQFVERNYLQTALFSWVWSFNSGRETTQKDVTHRLPSPGSSCDIVYTSHSAIFNLIVADRCTTLMSCSVKQALLLFMTLSTTV
jgi:hypothetical protein